MSFFPVLKFVQQISQGFSQLKMFLTDGDPIAANMNKRGKSFARSQSICTRIEIHLFFLGGNDVAL